MDCIFCSIIAKTIPAKILSETSHSLALLDAFPLARGHVLVLPKRHLQKIQDLELVENTDLFALVQSMTTRVDSAMTGSSLIAIHNGKDAGQDIPHLHAHIVPRSQDDPAGAIHSMFNKAPERMSEPVADQICKMLKDN